MKQTRKRFGGLVPIISNKTANPQVSAAAMDLLRLALELKRLGGRANPPDVSKWKPRPAERELDFRRGTSHLGATEDKAHSQV